MTTAERKIADLTRTVAETATNIANIADVPAYAQWLSEIRESSTRTLVAATSMLSSSGSRQANVKALREAIISEIELKNTEHLTKTMEKLDAAATNLGRYSLVLAVIGVVLAAIQVLQAFGLIRPL